MDEHNIIASQFADSIGMPRSSFSQLMTGRNKSINDATIAKIHVAFPQLSISWLLFGEGEMIQNVAEMPSGIEKGEKKQLTIFDENGLFETQSYGTSEYAKEIGPNISNEEQLQQTATIPSVTSFNKPERRAVKIVVFYNDNTYETFTAE